MYSRFIFFFNPSKSIAMKEKREYLSKNIRFFVDKHIEEADPKYKQERILFDEETKAKLSEDKIFIRRNSLRKTDFKLTEELNMMLEMHDDNNKNEKY